MERIRETWLDTVDKWDNVLSDMRIVEYDCQTFDGLRVRWLHGHPHVLRTLAERVLGRVSLDDIVDPETGVVLVKAGELIGERIAETIGNSSFDNVRIRSPLTCQSKNGVCATCFGIDPDGDPDQENLLNELCLANFGVDPGVDPDFPEMVAVGKPIGLSVIAALRKPKSGLVWRLPSFVMGETPENTYSNTDGTVRFGSLPEDMRLELVISRCCSSRLAQKLSSSSVSSDQEQFVLTIEPQGEKYHLLPEALIYVNDGKPVSRGELLFRQRRGYLKLHFPEDFASLVPLFDDLKMYPSDSLEKLSGSSGPVHLEHINAEKIILSVVSDTLPEWKITIEGADNIARISVREGALVDFGDQLLKGERNFCSLMDILGRKECFNVWFEDVLYEFLPYGYDIDDRFLEVIFKELSSGIKVADAGETTLSSWKVFDKE